VIKIRDVIAYCVFRLRFTVSFNVYQAKWVCVVSSYAWSYLLRTRSGLMYRAGLEFLILAAPHCMQQQQRHWLRLLCRPLRVSAEGSKGTHTQTYSKKPVAYRGGGGVSNQPPPPKFRRPSKILPNTTRLWKLLKIAEFRTPTLQDVRKKRQ